MSLREFTQWQLYERVEPFGERREDLRAGILCSLIDNLVKALYSKQPKFSKPEDFMLPWDPPEPVKPQTAEQQLKIFSFFANVQNALVEAKQNQWEQSS